jgi:2-methylisocitrate lyase-like PEP mutase family enzyme
MRSDRKVNDRTQQVREQNHQHPDKFFDALQGAGSAEGWLDRMQTRKELYETLDYDPAAESWPGYSSSRA